MAKTSERIIDVPRKEPWVRVCPNCHVKLGDDDPGHFVPPLFCQGGFYICPPFEEKKSQ